MGIIKKLAEKVLARDLSYLEKRLEECLAELESTYNQKIENLNKEIKKRDKKIAGLQAIIDSQSNDIIKLRKLTEKRPHFKRKKK